MRDRPAQTADADYFLLPCGCFHSPSVAENPLTLYIILYYCQIVNPIFQHFSSFSLFLFSTNFTILGTGHRSYEKNTATQKASDRRGGRSFRLYGSKCEILPALTRHHRNRTDTARLGVRKCRLKAEEQRILDVRIGGKGDSSPFLDNTGKER